MYISNDFFEKDYLYINNQDGTFKESLEEYLSEISMGSMGITESAWKTNVEWVSFSHPENLLNQFFLYLFFFQSFFLKNLLLLLEDMTL